MPFLDTGDVTLHYERSGGDGPPVVLIHGWCCDHTYFAPQADHFARLGHDVIALDLRGHGQSDRPEPPYAIAAFSGDVARLCGALGLSKPVVIGHSMGGTVAFDLATRYPDLPAAIVMVDSSVVPPLASHARSRAFCAALQGPDYAAAARAFVSQVFFLPTDDQARAARIIEAMTATPQSVMASAYAELSTYDAAAGAGQLRAPALYIAASGPTGRSDMDRLRALVPQVHVGRTVAAGHFCHLEAPEQVNAMIDRFLLVTGAGQLREHHP